MKEKTEEIKSHLKKLEQRFNELINERTERKIDDINTLNWGVKSPSEEESKDMKEKVKNEEKDLRTWLNDEMTAIEKALEEI